MLGLPLPDDRPLLSGQPSFTPQEKRMLRQSAIALLGLIAASMLGSSARAQQDSPVSQGLKIKG
jgi:hypothetical protein